MLKSPETFTGKTRGRADLCLNGERGACKVSAAPHASPWSEPCVASPLRRSLVQDEIQKMTEVISACQLSTAEAKSKRLVLLKQNRELHSRYLQAVKLSLSLVRDEHPSSAPPGDSSRGSAEAASARISGSTGRPENQDDQPEAPQPDGGKAARTEAGVVRLGVTRDSRPDVPAKSSSQVVTPPIVRAPLRVEDIMYDPEEEFGVFAESQLAVDAGHPDGSLVAPGGEGMDAGTQERLRLSRRVAASLQNRKRVEAAAAHVRPADVHWVLQSPYAVEGEEPLSFTSAMEGPECMASLYACHFVGLLEEGMLAAVLDQYEAAPADAEASAARSTAVLAVHASLAYADEQCDPRGRTRGRVPTAAAGLAMLPRDAAWWVGHCRRFTRTTRMYVPANVTACALAAEVHACHIRRAACDHATGCMHGQHGVTCMSHTHTNSYVCG